MIYSFGQYELDTRVYELRRAGAAHAVEPQVFDVLAYLIQHRDRVVSKDELLDKLWPDRFVAETTLSSRLKEARKAVGDTGKNQSVIRTQRGRGYRFVASVEERGDPSATAMVACVSGNYLVPKSGTAEPETSALEAFVASLTGTTGESHPDFVGRERELERLTDILRKALGGQRQIAFITGEAGAGKTTLVNTFLSDAPPDSPVLIARGQCVEYRGSGEAYMPLLDAFSRLAQGPRAELLVSLFRTHAPSWLLQMPAILTEAELESLRRSSGAAGERMARELGMLVERLTAETPVILILEDLHWSDYATLDAIDLLARHTQPARLMVIGTWRPSDVKAARHPVYALSQELRVKGQCEVIPLPLLEAAELETYLAGRFGGARFVRDLAPLLHERTAGNALFSRNLVDSWVERRLIRDEGGQWSLATDLAALGRDVPDSLQHLIENQVSQLDSEQQRVVELASVVGRSLSSALLAAALPAADDDVERELERLSHETHILRPAGTEQWGDGSLTSRYSFVHDLYVDAIYEGIPLARRSRLHLQIGQALEQAWHGREREHASELALHFQRALDRMRGARYLQLAAEQALERNAYREAVDHLSSALELLLGADKNRERDVAELHILCRLAPSLVATRGWNDSGAETSFLRARELAESLGETALLSQTLYGLANMYEYRGEYEIAERVVMERVALDTSSVPERALESHELLTCSLLHQGRYDESVRHGERALATFENADVQELDPDLLVLLVQAHGWISGSLHFADREEDALRHSAEALRMAADSGNELARASAHIQAAFLRFYRREPYECEQLALTGGAIAREMRFPFHVACSRILAPWAASTRTPSEDQVRDVRAGIRTAEAIGARMDLPVFHAVLTEILLGLGNHDDALEAIDRGIELLSLGRTYFYVPELHRLRAKVLRELGRDADAGEALRTALEIARDQSCVLFVRRVEQDLKL